MTGLPLPRLRIKKQEHLLEKKHCINIHTISKPWEGENELVCYRQHLHLQLLLVYIAAFISQTQWMHSGCNYIDVAEKTKILKCFWQSRWRVTPNSCNLVVMGLQLSFVFFCKQATAKLTRFLWRRIYIYSRNFECFVVDLSHLHLTFVTFCVLSVIRKQ